MLNSSVLPWRWTFTRILRMFIQVVVIAGPILLFRVFDINGFFKWITLSVPICMYATAITLAFGWLFDRESLFSLFGRAKFLFQKGK